MFLDKKIKNSTDKYKDKIKELSIKQFRYLIFNEGDTYGWGVNFYNPFVNQYNQIMDFF